MFYKIRQTIFISAITCFVAANAVAQGFDLMEEEEKKPATLQTQSAEKKEEAKPIAANTSLQDEIKVENISLGEETSLEESIDLPEPSQDEIAAFLNQETNTEKKPQSVENKPKEEIIEEETSIDISIDTPQEDIQIDEIDEYVQEIDDEIFSKMSELERESALLTLQLKKEKIKNDIDAVKKQRQAAEVQEEERKLALEERKRNQILEEQKKMLVEQQKLKEKEIEFEKLRQEKLLTQYKEEMLAQKQKWIANNANLYKDINVIKSEQIKSFDDIKTKFANIKVLTKKTNQNLVAAKTKKDKEIQSLKEQITVLKAQSRVSQSKNPFGSSDIKDVNKLDNIYAITEIRGQGNELIARLLNNEGQTFLAQKGTVLQSGHIVEEITETYLKAKKDGTDEYIQFISGGSIMQKEPIKKMMLNSQSLANPNETAEEEKPSKNAPRAYSVYKE